MLEEKGSQRLTKIGVTEVVTFKDFGENVSNFLERNEEYEHGEVKFYSSKSYDEFLNYLKPLGIDLEDKDFHIDDYLDTEVYIYNIENVYFGVIVA